MKSSFSCTDITIILMLADGYTAKEIAYSTARTPQYIRKRISVLKKRTRSRNTTNLIHRYASKAGV